MGKVCSKKALWNGKVLYQCAVVITDPRFRDIQYFFIVIHMIIIVTIINTNMLATLCLVL